MRLHYNTVSTQLFDSLQKLMEKDAFNDFVLVGGTALSLQLGHRISIDIDLFTAIDYGSMDLEKIKKTLLNTFPYIDNLDKLNGRNLGYSVYIGNNKNESVKLDLFYTDNFITPIVYQDNLRMASLQDIAAMKMETIVNSKRKKDFWDIHELLEHFTLKEMIRYGIQRNPYALTEESIMNVLCNLTEDTDLSNDKYVNCLRGKFWELIVDDLRITAEQYKKQRNQ